MLTSILYLINCQIPVSIIKNNFDLTPDGIINYLNLREPIYSKTTNYGHFGKDGLSYEKIVKLEI